MIGETAYEGKPGGRCLGTIVGQRTAQDAEGRPVEQWEIRSSRGIRFFMDKAGVRIGGPPPGGPPPGGPPPATEVEPVSAWEPEAPPVVPVVGAVTRLEVRTYIAQDLRQHRSPVPTVVTLVGAALCVVCGALFGLGLERTLGEVAGVPLAFAPGLLGLLIMLVGTNLISEPARRLGKRRAELVRQADARQRASEETR
jgi:hypothetical protein